PQQSVDRPSICFLAHNAFGSLAGHNQQHAGGIERQQALMAQWLAEHGWRVSMVTWNDRLDEPDEINGVHVYTMCERDAGLPVLRFFHPRWTSLTKALSAADADVYYYNCGDLALGQLVLWAKRRKRPVVFSVPSDPDCDPKLPALSRQREKLLYRHGLVNCGNVIVQSRRQQQLLKDGFSLDSTLLAMPSHGFAQQLQKRRKSDADKPFHVVWVGRISPEKRPDWFLQVARKLPDVRFTIIGAPNRDSEYATRVITEASELRNVKMVGRIPHERMGEFYPTADLLCLTSVYEGFPNVFLEAWSVGVPVVSTCDPDDLIKSRGLGRHASDINSISNAIKNLSSDSETWRNMSQASIRYFTERHAVDKAMGAFANYFRNVRQSFYGGTK
ncbi:MAG: glycosyltransferase family 4 protein, partial [Gammaproteobacteria bacterium]|nr:glycosyltransferase family 4 protein [Gammaproteobacteria bacterium]